MTPAPSLLFFAMALVVTLDFVTSLSMLTFFTFLILNILFKIVVNDVLNNLSMVVVTSLKLLEPCKKEIIEYDLEENIV